MKTLTPEELERLAILSEECAEVQQVIGKIIRHGYESYNPFDQEKTTNRSLLEKELGDLVFAMALMMSNIDVQEANIQAQKWKKRESIKKYLHYNTID